MKELEKARRLTHLFYVLRKQHATTCDEEPEMKMRDIMALGVMSSFIDKQRDGLVKMSEISELFRVTPAAVSQMVREYEKKGWLNRVVLEKDRRSVYLQVSDEAKILMHKHEEESLRGIVDFMQFIGEEDSDALIRIMEKAKAYGPILKHK